MRIAALVFSLVSLVVYRFLGITPRRSPFGDVALPAQSVAIIS